MVKKLIFVDLETTGANPVVDRITEVGIVEVDGEQVTRWSTLVNPGLPIPPFIQSLTGINDAMVKDAPTFAELAESLYQRLQGGLFIAHNARFDYGFLRNAFKEFGYTLRCEVLCTVKLSRILFPDETRHNLDTLISRHGLVADSRHRALADADLLWQFWSKMVAQIAPESFETALAQLLRRSSVPTHLPAEALDEIPDTAGVYLFFGESGAVLYVGKSIHLRERVLSHFNADHRIYKDMRISHEIHRLEWRETAGEIGALLLEAQLVKELQPIHNRMLRRQRELCSWQLRPQAEGGMQPVLAYADSADFGRAERLYGLFSSKRKAEAALREIAEGHELCLVTLGLENRVQAGKPCFAFQLRRCHGACVGKEALGVHQARLEMALEGMKVAAWPYDGPVGLIETSPDGTQTDVHLVHNWCWLGTAHSEHELSDLLEHAPARPAFDIDTYKILLRALANGQVKVRRLSARQIEPAMA